MIVHLSDIIITHFINLNVDLAQLVVHDVLLVEY